eukprot:TRINITY_DN20086_c0_g1_i1.p1 TRINITY_DN20086_c0_g1~~TRINITY_DN20086_c0_g1_i1.p1  ORF type:complete len:131 (-),score=20.88 TRINITY_DN20086_c0_g1_i1:310-702(-)
MADSRRDFPYNTGPFRSRDGLSSRASGAADHVQLRVDPIHGDLDEEIAGLHNKVSQLKHVAQEIGSEARFQNEFLNQLEMTMLKVQAGVKNNMKRLNRKIVQSGSSYVIYVICFGLILFFILYLLSKVSR